MTRPDELREQAEVLDNWTRAYPIDVFPVPPDFKLARNAAAAHVMREMALPQFAKDRDALIAAADRIEQLEAELLLARAGCRCARPLLGSRPGVGPRCRLCNVVAEDGAS